MTVDDIIDDACRPNIAMPSLWIFSSRYWQRRAQYVRQRHWRRRSREFKMPYQYIRSLWRKPPSEWVTKWKFKSLVPYCDDDGALKLKSLVGIITTDA